MTRTTMKASSFATRMARKSAIVAFLCAVILVVGVIRPSYAYGDTLSSAQTALSAAQKALTAAQNTLTNAQNALATANSNFSSLSTTKAKIDTVNSQANSSAGIKNDVVFTNQTPLYVPVNGNANKPANSTLVAVEGKYVDGTSDSTKRTQQQILDYINSVRKDAYNTKLADGTRVASSYKAVAWSKNLERTAQIRAAEISIYGDHTRPSGEAWYGVSNEGLMATSAENLSWGSNYYGNIKMWADEKADYVKYLNCSKGKKTVNGVNQCSYGVYGHYRNLVNPSYNKIGLAQFNTNRSTVNPYSTAMAAEFSAATNSNSSAVKAVNKTIYQGVYVKSTAVTSTAFSPSKVSGDPVWTRNAQVKEAKALAKSLASAEWKRIQSDYNTKQAAVTSAQNAVNTAQAAVVSARSAVSAAKERVVATGGTVKTTWTRLYGNNAYETMSRIAEEGFTTSETVVVSTSKDYYDALSASGIAGLYNAPILFTNPTKLSAQTKTQLTRLNPKRIIITGGTPAISADVEKEIKTLTGVTPQRYAGSTAMETADEVAKAGKGKWSKDAIVVTSKSYYDALSMGPYAYAKHSPIFYAKGGKTITDNSLSAMKTLGITNVYIVGSEVAIPASVEKQITDAGMTFNRIGGKDAMDTSRLVAQFCVSKGMKVNYIGIATTKSYYDGLAASPLLGKKNSILVLTNSKNLTAIDALYDHNDKGTIGDGFIFGDTTAVTQQVENYVSK